MSITRKRPETLPATLTLNGQGEKLKFDITYFNRRTSEFQSELEAAEDATHMVLFVVKEWDAEYLGYPLTKEGIEALEDDMPGFIMGVLGGFHESRSVQKAKNS